MGNDGFEDFVTDGGEDALVVVLTEILCTREYSCYPSNPLLSCVTYLIYPRQHPDLRPVQHAERQTHHLQVLASRRGADIARLRAHIEGNGFLQPRDEKVGTFVADLVADTLQAVEDDGAGAALDVVDAGAGEREDGRGWNCVFVDVAERVGRHFVGIGWEEAGWVTRW